MGLAYLIIFLIWGWAEMSAFIFVGNMVGGLLTLLGIFFTAIIGITLLKQQGITVLTRIRTEMRDGDAARLLDMLAALSHQTNLSVGCYCEDEAHCHRSVLRALLKERGAKLAP